MKNNIQEPFNTCKTCKFIASIGGPSLIGYVSYHCWAKPITNYITGHSYPTTPDVVRGEDSFCPLWEQKLSIFNKIKNLFKINHDS